MITDACPYCDKSYAWDNDQDTYVGTTEIELMQRYQERKVTLFQCICGAILATMVDDEFGGQVYTPSTKEL